MTPRPLRLRLFYAARDLRAGALFQALCAHGTGDVLDVGGGSGFFAAARARGARFTRWTTLEIDASDLPRRDHPALHVVVGDGCALPFRSASFDTALNVQVLEHVFEPLLMVQEIARILKPGGKALFLIPQTSVAHLVPRYYGNLSRYWIAEALERAGFELVLFRPLGGVWSSMASHLLLFFFQAARARGLSDPAIRRNALFYLLLPLMVLWALVSLPVCLLFALGDLQEEPNNHLVVARRSSHSPG